MYVQQTFNLNDPPAPMDPVTIDVQNDTANAHIPEDNPDIGLDAPPTDFVSPLRSNATIDGESADPKPDPKDYEQVGGPMF